MPVVGGADEYRIDVLRLQDAAVVVVDLGAFSGHRARVLGAAAIRVADRGELDPGKLERLFHQLLRSRPRAEDSHPDPRLGRLFSKRLGHQARGRRGQHRRLHELSSIHGKFLLGLLLAFLAFFWGYSALVDFLRD